MKKIFFIEDDPLIVEIYRRKFVDEGFQVEVAADGIAAMRMLATTTPDLVVLDLMMPKLSGSDVLKFMRSNPNLNSVPVIILSNSYMTDAAHQAAVAGANKALLKSRCTPKLLVNVVQEILSGAESSLDRSFLLATQEITPVAAPSPPVTPVPQQSVSRPEPPVQEVPKNEVPAKEDFRAKEEAHASFDQKVVQDFLDHTPATLATMRQLCDAFANSTDPKVRALRLDDLNRKARFFTSLAAMAGYHQLAQLSSALEALVLELHGRPNLIRPSTVETVSQAIECLGELFKHARTAGSQPMPQINVLVIDDDIIGDRLVVSALNRANFKAASADNPLTAFKMLQEKKYDLILLDINLPTMSGFEFCRKLRSLEHYRKRPVVFVTCRTDSESREEAIASGGNELISKPILPIELAVKAVTHILKNQLPEQSESKPAAN